MFVYDVVPGVIQTTNATPLTANDCFFVKSGATRTLWLQSILVQGRGAALTAISGLSFRLEKWTTTASSGGTAVTPAPTDIGMQAAKGTAGYAVATVTSGTGGPTLLKSFGCGATGPGGWVAQNVDSMKCLEAAATQSIDLFCASGTASLSFEADAEIVE
jgi:hypothetical protein